MQFVRDASFESFVLETPLGDVPRLCELNMRLIGRYLAPGEEFMKHFYTTGNKSPSANMEQSDGCLAEGTVMARCEKELQDAQTQGFLKKEADAHMLSMDICTMGKGCVFEWTLNDREMDMEASLKRIVGEYLCEGLDSVPNE